MRLSATAVMFILANFFLAACGGRVARLVEPRSALDPRLNCDHIEAEFTTHLSRLRELSAERKRGARDNVGILVMSPFFLNLSDSEKREAAALQERNKILLELAGQRQCTAGILQPLQVEQVTSKDR